MKAISFWQPWATAVAVGSKRFETRSWRTSYRGILAIHAAKRNHRVELGQMLNQCMWIAATDGCSNRADLPFGCIVAIADLVDCIPCELIGKRSHRRIADAICAMRGSGAYQYSDYELGDFSPGRFAWQLENVFKLTSPIPYKGKQGLFEVPDYLFHPG